MPFKYIGRTTDFQGKTLWEIVGNLKKFGVGRYVIRNMFQRYPEPSYMKIVKVETLPNPSNPSLDNLRKVKVYVEKTFRGRTCPTLIKIESTSYKSDYKLIPKDEEDKLISRKGSITEKILPKSIGFPPLMKELIYRDAKARGETVKEEPKLEIVYKKSKESYFRIAADGETPNVEVVSGLGTPASPGLYKGLKP